MKHIRGKPVFAVVLFLILVLGCSPAAVTPAAEVQSAEPPTAAVPTSGEALSPLATATLATAAASPTPAGAQPAATSLPAPTPILPLRTMAIQEPVSGATITSPVHVHGQVSIAPFESTFRGRVYDAAGSVVGEGPVMVAAEMGQPGDFAGYLTFAAGAGGAGRVELAELSAKDGSVIISASVDVQLAPAVGSGAIEIPEPGARVTLPLHILARGGAPGELVTATLTWLDGTVLQHTFSLLAGEDGRGLLIDSLNWPGESWPPEPATQMATLEIRSEGGDLVAQQVVTVLSPDDPEVREITLYFLLGETLQAVQQRIPGTAQIGTATLNELLWGPPVPNLAGFETALPAPQQVLEFPGRGPDWGPRVTLLSLTISDGIALADFSREMEAYGGGSLRVHLIREQIVQTLKQFETVQQVIIAVEGETETVLQP